MSLNKRASLLRKLLNAQNRADDAASIGWIALRQAWDIKIAAIHAELRALEHQHRTKASCREVT